MKKYQNELDFQKAFETQYTYINGFMRNVMRCADRPALYDLPTGKRWTYSKLNDTVNQLANAFVTDGVGKGSVVMYMLPNSPEFVFCYLAPQKLGAVNCPVSYLLSPGELAFNIDDNEPTVFVYDVLYQEQVEKALEMAKYRPARILAADTENSSGTKTAGGEAVPFDDYLSGEPETEPESDPLSIYDECTRFYTSGTTSHPNGISLRSINEVLSAHDVIMGFAMTPRDRTMNLTPWFHRGGLHSGGPCPTLYVGGEVMILHNTRVDHYLDLVEQHKITFLIGVPSVFNVLCRVQKKQNADLSSLRGIVTMGSPLDSATCIRFQQMLTPNVFNGYGTTETFWNTFLRPYDLPEMAGSAGQACIDDDVRVVHTYPDRRAQTDDLVARDGKETGEIIIHSPAKMTLEYYKNPELTEKKFHDGFFYTGDLGTWDENSYVTICGRKDDMIVTSGENVHAVQVESVLNEHSKVADSCVVGIPDALRGQIVVAYVLPEEDSGLTVQELKSFVASHPMMAEYKRPRYYCICSQLPYTKTGKLQRSVVRMQAKDDLKKGLLKRTAD